MKTVCEQTNEKIIYFEKRNKNRTGTIKVGGGLSAGQYVTIFAENLIIAEELIAKYREKYGED